MNHNIDEQFCIFSFTPGAASSNMSCNAMEMLPLFGDSCAGQMPRLCSGDPFAMFHLYPEPPIQMTGPEEMPLFPSMPEQLTDENYFRDPYSFQFPVPCGNLSKCEYLCGPAFIRKRNERERQRVKCVNEGYAKLRHHLPAEYFEKRLSKVETLRAAIKYIRFLQSVLCSDSEENSKAAHHTSQEDSQSDTVPRTSQSAPEQTQSFLGTQELSCQ